MEHLLSALAALWGRIFAPQECQSCRSMRDERVAHLAAQWLRLEGAIGRLESLASAPSHHHPVRRSILMPDPVSSVPAQPKSGLVSTEFYATIVFAIVMGLVAVGVIPAGDADLVKDQLGQLVHEGVALFAALVPVYAYVRGRLNLKAAHVAAVAAVESEDFKV